MPKENASTIGFEKRIRVAACILRDGIRSVILCFGAAIIVLQLGRIQF